MNKERKKQYFTVFVLIMFLGSGLAYAFTLLPGDSTQQSSSELELFVERPLSEAEESQYFYKNMVAVKLFYGPNCGECDIIRDDLKSMQGRLGGRFVIENINVETYKGDANRLNVTDVPKVFISGIADAVPLSYETSSDLLYGICSQYFQQIQECSL